LLPSNSTEIQLKSDVNWKTQQSPLLCYLKAQQTLKLSKLLYSIGKKHPFQLIWNHLCLGSVKTDLMEIGANSTLLVAKVNKTDSGNYTCSIGEAQQYTVLVHVLNGK